MGSTTVENINLDGTDNAPGVAFDFEANHFRLTGMCFMEDVSGFFDPITTPFEKHVAALSGADVTFEFGLHYFNSSAARVVLMLFDFLDEVAAKGNAVSIVWHHEDDEDMIEQGEEFGEDLEHATFTIVNDDA